MWVWVCVGVIVVFRVWVCSYVLILNRVHTCMRLSLYMWFNKSLQGCVSFCVCINMSVCMCIVTCVHQHVCVYVHCYVCALLASCQCPPDCAICVLGWTLHRSRKKNGAWRMQLLSCLFVPKAGSEDGKMERGRDAIA